jgi:hypothetical protein
VNQVLEWLKGNVFTVVFAVVALAALIAMPLVASNMNNSVREQLGQRVRKINEMQQLERTQVAVPGQAAGQAALINQRLLESYRASIDVAREDAERVVAAAIEHNRKGRGVVMPQVLPKPSRDEREILPQQFHERLMDEYDRLLAKVNVGMPPALEELREEIERQEGQFRMQMLAKEIDAELSPDEQTRLTEHLSDLRLLKYQEAAAAITYYLDRGDLYLPHFTRNPLPTLAEMYDWQWKLWIHQDILHALADANSGAASVLDGPVKHIRFVNVLGSTPSSSQPGAGGSPLGGGQPGGRSGGAGGRPGAPGDGASPATPADAPLGPPVLPDPKVEVPLKYTSSFTGRATSTLYDVRNVDIELVVDSHQLPHVLDALAKRNFITVIWLRVTPADPYEAAQDGFFYGSGAHALVRMQLETVWLRAWTAQFMPAEVRQALGIQTQQQAG